MATKIAVQTQQVADAAKKDTKSNHQKNSLKQQSSPHCYYPWHYCWPWNSVIISIDNDHIECCSHTIHGPAMSAVVSQQQQGISIPTSTTTVPTAKRNNYAARCGIREHVQVTWQKLVRQQKKPPVLV